MKDQDKTKEQLIDELVELRQRITELETAETERKRGEEELRETEERFRELVENANDIIYTHDLEGNFTSANPAATRIYGYTIEEILQLDIAQIVDLEYLPLARQKIREKLEGAPRTGPYELLTYSKEDEAIWVEVSTRLLEREGQPVGVLGIARDITEPKRAEEALRESEEKLKAQYKGIPVPTYTWQRVGEDFVLVDYNDAAVAITQGKIADFVGIEARELYWDMPGILEEISRCFSEKTTIEREMVYRYKSTGESKHLAVKYAFVPPDLVLVHTEDITELKQAEEELRRSYVKLQKALEGTIRTLVSAIEMKDPHTAGHQRRVTQLACAIAKEMGLPKEQIEGIRIAGLIHDIGKINVPAEILSKPGPLNDLQYGLIKNHARVGHDVLNGTTEFPWPLAKIVLQHHERLDGSGYPAGLSGEEIMLEARILAVADVVEAMASHRPYRPPRGLDKALEEISQNRGVLYDPEVVDTCLKLFTEKGLKFE